MRTTALSSGVPGDLDLLLGFDCNAAENKSVARWSSCNPDFPIGLRAKSNSQHFYFLSRRGGEGFFEDGLEEMGGMCASLLDLGFQRPASCHQ